MSVNSLFDNGKCAKKGNSGAAERFNVHNRWWSNAEPAV
jgi:hypothetical protein